MDLEELLPLKECLQMPQLHTSHRQANQDRKETEGEHPGVGCFIKILHFFFPVSDKWIKKHN